MRWLALSEPPQIRFDEAHMSAIALQRWLSMGGFVASLLYVAAIALC
jgi:hypothetical protein